MRKQKAAAEVSADTIPQVAPEAPPPRTATRNPGAAILPPLGPAFATSPTISTRFLSCRLLRWYYFPRNSCWFPAVESRNGPMSWLPASTVVDCSSAARPVPTRGSDGCPQLPLLLPRYAVAKGINKPVSQAANWYKCRLPNHFPPLNADSPDSTGDPPSFLGSTHHRHHAALLVHAGPCRPCECAATRMRPLSRR